MKIKTTQKIWETIYKSYRYTYGNGNLPEEFTVKGLVLKKPKHIADTFSDTFATIGSELASAIPATDTSFKAFMHGDFPNTFVMFPTTPSNIVNIDN